MKIVKRRGERIAQIDRHSQISLDSLRQDLTILCGRAAEEFEAATLALDLAAAKFSGASKALRYFDSFLCPEIVRTSPQPVNP